MDGIYMNVVFLPPRRGILAPPMYVPSNSAVGGKKDFTTPDVRSLISWVPPGNPENHQFSSQPPGQQKPWKWVPRLPKIMKDRPWNHKKSNLCESWFQYLPCQMLVFAFPTPKLRPKNYQKKQPENRYEKNLLFCPKLSKNLSKSVP